MDYSNFKLPQLNIKAIIVAVTLGVLAAIGIYQAQSRGLIPRINLKVPETVNFETRTVISEENAVISAVEGTSSSVVAIGISKRVYDPFDPFSVPRKTDSTIGTGFVVSENGVIVTNKHVVSDPGQYTVITKDGQKYEVEKIYRDPSLDLAIVKIKTSNLKPLELGDSSKIKVGQTVIAIGNALGKLTNTVTTGVVSGLGRNVTAGNLFEGLESLDNLIQTDAAINPGNSGGPLLSSAGQVIGVNVATTEGAENIGFAIPINSVKQIVEEFIKSGSIIRPYLGIRYRFISKDVAILNEVPQGAFVQEVLEDGPAAKAGLKFGDIITKIAGQTINEENKVSEIISKSNIGQSLELNVWREGSELKLTPTIGEAPNQ